MGFLEVGLRFDRRAGVEVCRALIEQGGAREH